MSAPSPNSSEVATDQLIRRYLLNRGWRDWISTVAIVILVCWNIVCQSDKVQMRRERELEHAARQKQIDALQKIADDLRKENAEFRRIQAMQAEDPKRFGMIESQHEAIRRYERTRTAKGRGDK